MSASTNCDTCGAELEIGDRFCNTCGASARRCATCGAGLAPADSRCSQCGSTSVLVGTRVGSVTPATGPGSASAWDRVLDRLRIATANQFEIMRELGRGGMAAVYLANEIGLSRLVAIKVMSPGLLMDDAMVERFRQEAVTLANLNHSHIVPIFAVREVEDLHFFVMKFIEGRPLDEVIRDGPPLSIPLVQAILFQVGSALASAHRRGIIHRDIKPANILLDIDGNAIVTDFGIAKVAEVPGQTQTGSMVGTPTYMSPEQCRGDTVGIASDQYSLGIVAYELLTGRPPFTGPTLMVMQAHTEKVPRSIRDLRPDCPEGLEAAILRMLEKDPAKRWGSTTEAAAAAGGRALAEEDPIRSQLTALASAGLERPAQRIPVSRPPRRTAEPIVTAEPAVRREPAAPAAGPLGAVTDRAPGKRRWIFAASAGVVVLAGAVAVALRSPRPPTHSVGVPVAPSPPARDSAKLPAAEAPATQSTTDRPDNAVTVASITLAPGDTSVAAGAHFSLRATVRDSRQHLMTGRAIRWHSTNPAVAAVDSVNGVVSAGRSTGLARITGVLNGVRSSVAVHVLALAAPPEQGAVAQAATHASPATPRTDVPVTVAPPPPAPPPTPPPVAAAVVPAAPDVNRFIDACVNAFSSGKKDRITAAYGAPGTPQDAKNRDELTSATTRNLTARLSAAPQTHATGPGAAEASFQLTFSFMPNSFTRSTRAAGPYPFRISLERSGGEWNPVGCHSDATIVLH